MKAPVKKKLEKAGWHIGDAGNFLRLSDEESAYLEIKIALTEALVKTRSIAGISQSALAKMMLSIPSRVAKMEAVDSPELASLAMTVVVNTALRKKCFAPIR